MKLYEGNKIHYVYIKDYDKLIGNQTSKSPHKSFHCRYCQHGLKKKHKSILDKHLSSVCLAVEGQSVKMPEAGETIKFKKHNNKFKCPYVIYGDFECLTTKTCIMSKPLVQDTKTIKYQNHKPSGFKLNVVNSITNTSKHYIYRGFDCMEKFMKQSRVLRKKLW